MSQAPIPPSPQPPQPEPPRPQPSPGPSIPNPGEISPAPGPDIQPPVPMPADMPPPMARAGGIGACAAMIILASVAALSSTAGAQNLTPPGAPSGSAAPPATSPATPPEITPDHPGGGRPNLSASNGDDGVIPPPANVGDSGINQRVPAVGTMPVILPPGTPGGNQQVQPK